MCNIDDFKFLAEMTQHVPLALRARYVFCCAPINRKMPFVCSMFLKFARQFSRNEPVTFDWLVGNCGWPFHLPKTILDLVQLEAVFDVMDLYLWLSYRFVELFPHAAMVRETQRELDDLIQQGVFQITRLLKNTEAAAANSASTPLSGGDGGELRAPRSATFYREPRPATGRGRLTERLLAQGLLTPSMLQELQTEWKKTDGVDGKSGLAEASTSSAMKKGTRRKRKT